MTGMIALVQELLLVSIWPSKLLCLSQLEWYAIAPCRMHTRTARFVFRITGTEPKPLFNLKSPRQDFGLNCSVPAFYTLRSMKNVSAIMPPAWYSSLKKLLPVASQIMGPS